MRLAAAPAMQLAAATTLKRARSASYRFIPSRAGRRPAGLLQPSSINTAQIASLPPATPGWPAAAKIESIKGPIESWNNYGNKVDPAKDGI